MCWNLNGPDVIVSFAVDREGEAARQRAVDGHAGATQEGFTSLREAHTAAWRSFWSASAVALPERDMEFLWYFGIYLLASSARRGRNPPGLQALWTEDGGMCPWRGDYHADINVQETFWPACPGGHLELMDVWLDPMYDSLPAAEAFTRKVFGTGGAFQLCTTLPGYTTILECCWDPFGMAWSNTAFLAHLAWLRWRYSMDTGWLRARGYPIVKSAFVFYSENLEEEADGRYHIPLSSSPEYLEGRPDSWARDPNIDIALIRKCCDWVAEMEKALEIDELTARAEEIHDRLVPYHLVEFDIPGNARPPEGTPVLALWKDRPLDRSHRHPSHLMAIHPAMDITIDGTERDRRIIDGSVLHYLALGRYCWAWHTYGQMVSMAAVIGRAEMAYSFLRYFRDNCVLTNGLLTNAGGFQGTSYFSRPMDSGEAEGDILIQQQHVVFTIDASCGISCGISDMLVQGWGDTVRIFPAAPPRWQDALFIDLLTEGAFKVSALKVEGRVRWVRIRSAVERLCRLKNPFGARPFETEGCDPRQEGNLLVWPMSEGQTATLFVAGYGSPGLKKEFDRIGKLEVRTLSIE